MIPRIVDSISSFFGPMMNTMYAVQADLYQHLYASVHEYATSQGLNQTENVVDECLASFEPMRQKAENEIKSLREGKVARTPMGGGLSKPGLFTRKSSASSASSRASSLKPPAPSAPPISSPRLGNQRTSFSGKLPPPPPPPSAPSPSLKSPSLSPANYRTASSPTLSPPSYNSLQNNVRPVNGNSRTQSASSITSMDVKKKKPPPPPPKPSISPKPEFVVAKYDFAGENAGDLAFSTGSRIKVTKKTDSLEDWWEGELNGKRGQFPRNYCE
jgi:amphiphysin